MSQLNLVKLTALEGIAEDPSLNNVSCALTAAASQQPFSPANSSAADPEGSSTSPSSSSSNKSGDSYEFWCELLSPWVLGKELLNILYQDGIYSVLDCHFLRPGNSVSVQRMIVFWNMLISFRLRGLPYTFLLSNESVVQAFPLPPPPGGSNSSALSSANSSMRPVAGTSSAATSSVTKSSGTSGLDGVGTSGSKLPPVSTPQPEGTSTNVIITSVSQDESSVGGAGVSVGNGSSTNEGFEHHSSGADVSLDNVTVDSTSTTTSNIGNEDEVEGHANHREPTSHDD